MLNKILRFIKLYLHYVTGKVHTNTTHSKQKGHTMSAKKQIISPIGEFKWCFITKARENLSGVKQFSITVNMQPKEAQPLIDEIMAVWAESGIKKQMKSAGYKTEDDGTVSFNFKTNAVFADGSANSVPTFDSKGKKVELGDKLLGNGSRGRVKATAATYESGANAGVTLYLNSVQITKFVEYEGGESFDALEGDGFSGMELDEFVASEPATQIPTQAAVPKF
jgi:hypothetical protein